MKIGLFFGSFNPIHLGHLIIANTIIEQNYVNEVWFVISPQSPFKLEGLLNENDRYNLVCIAIKDNPKFKVNKIEFELPKPNFTYLTLREIRKQNPNKEFYLIMGEDNLIEFKNWNYYEEILKNHNLIIYPRPNVEKSELLNHAKISSIEAPLFEISATFIRNSIRNKKSVKYLLPDEVEKYINNFNLYNNI